MCRVTFSPNIVQQARIATNGLLGDFVIRYDVQRDMGIGDIQVNTQQGNVRRKDTVYTFAQYFWPPQKPNMPLFPALLRF